MKDSSRRSLTIVAAVAIVALLTAGVMLSDRGSGEEPKAPAASATSVGGDDPRTAEDQVGLTRRDADDVTAMGDVDAPLVLIEYSDYRCPFCGAFARETMPRLKKDYIDTGKLRFEWRDFPVFGEESMAGAMAARAAGEQGLYWQYHDAMYADAPERGHLKITRAKVLAWAKQVEVPDMDKFTQELEDEDLRAKVEADGTEASRIGATGTPTFVLGTDLIVGAQPEEAFRQAIDEQLAALDD